MTQIVKNPGQLSEDTICQIHKVTLKSNRIGSYNVRLPQASANDDEFISLQDGENTILYLNHLGVYRKRLVTTSLTPENIVQYTHQSKVPSEMNLFVGMMKVSSSPPNFLSSLEVGLQKCLEEKDAPPFAMAAWIHAMFGRIHPFTVSVL